MIVTFCDRRDRIVRLSATRPGRTGSCGYASEPTTRWPIRARVAAMDEASRSPTVTLADDALLGLLLPFWQLVIAAVVLVVVVLSVVRLARRGPSRMGTALLVTAAAIIGLAVAGVLLS